jgi:hypothetical protein
LTNEGKGSDEGREKNVDLIGKRRKNSDEGREETLND